MDVYKLVIPCLAIFWIYGVKSQLVIPQKRCIPTSVTRGPCHTCVCTTAGVFHCRSETCSLPMLKNITRNAEEANVINEGDTCTPGKLYRVDCNTCRCSDSGALLCTKMVCLGDSDKKYVKKLRMENDDTKSGSKKLMELPKTKCMPGKIYSKGCQRCFCTYKKTAVCTSKPCGETSVEIEVPEDVSPRMGGNEFQGLPRLPHAAAKCKPGMTYKVECNSCLCLSSGNMMCGKMLCLSPEEKNRLEALKHSGKPCTKDDVEELECVTCTCVLGRQRCDPKPKCVPVRLRRQLHGKVVEEVDPSLNLNLTNNDEKCLPNMVYKLNCNNCYCQADHSLRCTRKGCLNYQQQKYLEKQKERILKLEGE